MKRKIKEITDFKKACKFGKFFISRFMFLPEGDYNIFRKTIKKYGKSGDTLHILNYVIDNTLYVWEFVVSSEEKKEFKELFKQETKKLEKIKNKSYEN